MLLSDYIARFSHADFVGEALVALDDLALAARMTEAAAEEGISPGDYVRRAIDRYVAGAGDDEWLTLIALMSQSRDPGTAFLRKALASTWDCAKELPAEPLTAAVGHPGSRDR